jgi:hypothetical protein
LQSYPEYAEVEAKEEIRNNTTVNSDKDVKAYKQANLDVYQAYIDVCNKINVSDENEKKSLLALKLSYEYYLNTLTCLYNDDSMMYWNGRTTKIDD